jgi:hypothetical protein
LGLTITKSSQKKISLVKIFPIIPRACLNFRKIFSLDYVELALKKLAWGWGALWFGRFQNDK